MRVINGNLAVVEAIMQVCPDVIPVYPQPPSAPIIDNVATLVANGDLESEFIPVESDQSAISGCIGASAAGARVFSATASQGLSRMQEFLFIAASLRLPIVLGVVNSALSAPHNMHADHSNIITQRDCGWIQILSENSQEVYDNTIQAFKIAENSDVRTPVMSAMDANITSHTYENVLIEDSAEVLDFVGKIESKHTILDVENPKTYGSFANSDYYFEHKINQARGLETSRKLIKEIGKEYGDRFGRYYGYFESYKLDDAEYAVVIMGSSSGTAKESIELLRSEGIKAGLLKLRIFRPFPFQEIKETLAHLKGIAVMDRMICPGSFGGPLFQEIRSSLYELENKPLIIPFIYGLGGRDIGIIHFKDTVRLVQEASSTGKFDESVRYLNARE